MPGPGEHQFANSAIWLASILGGKPRKLRGGAFRAMLSPDDALIAYMNDDGIGLAASDGADPRQFVVAGDREAVGSPAWSADGQRILYRRAVWDDDGPTTSIESRGLDEQTSIVLVRDSWPATSYGDPVWAKDFLMIGDRLIYVRHEPAPRSRDRNLWQIAIDPDSGRPAGEPKRLTDWAGFGFKDLSVTADGSRLVFGNDHTQEDVYVGALTDGGWSLAPPRRLTLDDRDDRPSCWTPDGAVLFESNRNGSGDLLVQGLDERTARGLFPGAGEQYGARLTPDGTAVLFWDDRSGAGGPGVAKRLVRAPVGGGPTELVLEAQASATFDCAATAGGPCVLIEPRLEKGRATLSRLDPLHGKGQALRSIEISAAVDVDTALSPDGRHLAMLRDENLPSIRVLDAATGEVVREVELEGLVGAHVKELEWAPGGDGFYLVGETLVGVALIRADLEGQARVLHEDPASDFSSAMPSPDGRHLAFGQAPWDTNAWIIEGL